MTPSASMHLFNAREPQGDRGVLWASVVAILFAAVAAISFAVDQTVTLCASPGPQPTQSTGR